MSLRQGYMYIEEKKECLNKFGLRSHWHLNHPQSILFRFIGFSGILVKANLIVSNH